MDSDPGKKSGSSENLQSSRTEDSSEVREAASERLIVEGESEPNGYPLVTTAPADNIGDSTRTPPSESGGGGGGTESDGEFTKPLATSPLEVTKGTAELEKNDESGKSGESDRSADEGASDAASNSSSGSHKTKKSNRCQVCHKKVGLTGFVCRCGGLFCSVHRYSDKHQCTFNYRELGAEEIRKNNPVVLSEKIHKI